MSAEGPPFSLEAGCAQRIRVGTLYMTPVEVRPSDGLLAEEIGQHAATLTERFRGVAPAQIDSLAPARQLYRAFGIDPTRTRPSSEKLLRRVLQGKGLPRISNAVDLGNLIALGLMLPIGLYDADRIEGAVALRGGHQGESYEGIAGQRVGLEGRPTLADDRGAFGNPTADSARTAVGDTTVAVWLTVFAPATETESNLRQSMEQVRQSMMRHLPPAGRLATCRIELVGFDQ